MPNEFYHLCVLLMRIHYLEVSPRCFWFDQSSMLELLNKSVECVVAFFVLKKIASCLFLVRSGLSYIFHWYAQPCVFNRSVLSVEAEVFTEFTMLNKTVSSAKNVTLEFSPCG